MSHIRDVSNQIDFSGLELGADKKYATSYDNYNGPWHQAVHKTVEHIDHYVSGLIGSVMSSTSSVEFDVDYAVRAIANYGATAREHQKGTEALAQGHDELRRILAGTNNEHALRGMDELNAASEASARTDERMLAISEALGLEIKLRVEDLMKALGAATNQVYLPLVGDSELGRITDMATMQPGSLSSLAFRGDVSGPLQDGYELIDSYRREQLLGGEDPR